MAYVRSITWSVTLYSLSALIADTVAVVMAFSALDAYLASLPNGIDRSFSECKVKASLIREPLTIKPLRSINRLPPEVATIVAKLPLPSEWVPATHYAAVLMALVDEYGLDREGYIAFSREVTGALTEGMYSVLLGMLHPETLMRGASSLWGYFHRGSTLSARRVDGVFEAVLTTPTGLLPQRLIEGYAGTIEALVERSRVPQARSERPSMRTSGANTVATFRIGGW